MSPRGSLNQNMLHFREEIKSRWATSLCSVSPHERVSQSCIDLLRKRVISKGKKCIWNKSPVSLQRQKKTISIPAQVQEKISLQCYQRCCKSPTWRRIKVVLWAVDPARGAVAGNVGMEGCRLKFIFWQNQKTCWAPCGTCEMSLVLEGSLDSQDLLRETIPTHREVPGEVRKAGNQENNQKFPYPGARHPSKVVSQADGHQLCTKPLLMFFPFTISMKNLQHLEQHFQLILWQKTRVGK